MRAPLPGAPVGDPALVPETDSQRGALRVMEKGKQTQKEKYANLSPAGTPSCRGLFASGVWCGLFHWVDQASTAGFLLYRAVAGLAPDAR